MAAASHDTAAPEISQSILFSNLLSDRPNLFQTQSLYLNHQDLLLRLFLILSIISIFFSARQIRIQFRPPQGSVPATKAGLFSEVST